MSTTETDAAWPQQIRLAGQTAAHPGPVDMSMMYVMHHAFRRDLAAFTAAARATPVSDRRAWAALAERWALFAEALHHHHSGEDRALWPLLLERTDAAGRATLRAMEDEHAEIDPILEACAAGFERLAHHPDEDALHKIRSHYPETPIHFTDATDHIRQRAAAVGALPPAELPLRLEFGGAPSA